MIMNSLICARAFLSLERGRRGTALTHLHRTHESALRRGHVGGLGAPCPGGFHPQLRDKNGRDIGKSQSKWHACTLETPGSPSRAAAAAAGGCSPRW
jgi:hypothetical protein